MSTVVFGAGGGVGLECVKQLLQQGQSVKAVVRTPDKYSDVFPNNEKLQVTAGDVTDPQSVATSLTGARAAIFAASGSGYWSADAVDFKGVIHVADAAKQQKLERVVLVSSCLVTKKHRFHPVRLMLNNIRWSLMDRKLDGEDYLRTSGISYTIVRPGGLKNAPAGQGQLEVGQGDIILGSVARADVAAVCVAAMTSPQAKNATFELLSKPVDKPASMSQQLSTLFNGIAADNTDASTR